MLARLVLNSWPCDLPALASQSAGITGVSHCTQPLFLFKIQTGSHYIDQAGLKILGSSNPALTSQSTGVTVWGTAPGWVAVCMFFFLGCAWTPNKVHGEEPLCGLEFLLCLWSQVLTYSHRVSHLASSNSLKLFYSILIILLVWYSVSSSSEVLLSHFFVEVSFIRLWVGCPVISALWWVSEK